MEADLAPQCALLLTVRVKCSPDDTVGDLKKLIAAQTGTDSSKIQLKKWQEFTSRLITLRGLTKFYRISQVYNL